MNHVHTPAEMCLTRACAELGYASNVLAADDFQADELEGLGLSLKQAQVYLDHLTAQVDEVIDG